jgi:hypothetical protein
MAGMGYVKDRWIEAMQPTPQEWERRWIAVSERLPEEDEDVLVMTAEGKFASGGMHVASLDEDGVWYPSHGDGWEFPDVTHWMPLPEPPEVK